MVLSCDCCCFLPSSTTCQCVLHQTPDYSLMTHDYSVILMHWKNGKPDGRWQMKFSPEKCQVISICASRKHRRKTVYILHGHTLETVNSAKYLAVTISQDLTWKNHVNSVAVKALRTLGFLMHNLYNCNSDVREQAYNSLVLPILEYTATVWVPHTSADINWLEQVQRRGARFTMNNYWEKTPGYVTRMVHDIGRQTLEERRKLRLTMLFKFQHGLTDLMLYLVKYCTQMTGNERRSPIVPSRCNS